VLRYKCEKKHSGKCCGMLLSEEGALGLVRKDMKRYFSTIRQRAVDVQSNVGPHLKEHNWNDKSRFTEEKVTLRNNDPHQFPQIVLIFNK
jgi:hypothetical protein